MGKEMSNHPFWHYCRKCVNFTKTVVIFLLLNSLADFATFKPIHTFYEHMGWIK